MRRTILYSSLTILSVVLLAFLETHVQFFLIGLHIVLFTLIVTIAALYCDKITGIVAIITSSIAVDYATKPYGLDFNNMTKLRVLEFLAVSTVIYALAWRSRTLKSENTNLEHISQQLKKAADKLALDNTKDIEKIKKLQEFNKQLQKLVKQFVEDDAYWTRRWPAREKKILMSPKQKEKQI